jgi:alanine dehydrogenase
MIVGIPKEIKSQEHRVAIVPGGVEVLVTRGHTVLVEKSAGAGSAIADEAFLGCGAQLASRDDVFGRADMIMKVKEPLPAEYPLLRAGQILYTYLHLASNEALTRALLERQVIGIAYETVEERGRLPLLTPMSEVAGRVSVQVGARFMEKAQGGRGVLLSGVPGVPPAKVVVLGGGIVGRNATQVAVGMGAQVVVLDIDTDVLARIEETYHGRLTTLKSTPLNIREAIRDADLVIGAVLVKGDKAPYLVTRDMLKTMKKGAVIVDVSIDQGGCVETSRATTHADPVYEVDGIIHYCVANMPGGVPLTSTYALTNATLRYAIELADHGAVKAMTEREGLRKGLNVWKGVVTFKPIADLFRLPFKTPEDVLGIASAR